MTPSQEKRIEAAYCGQAMSYSTIELEEPADYIRDVEKFLPVAVEYRGGDGLHIPKIIAVCENCEHCAFNRSETGAVRVCVNFAHIVGYVETGAFYWCAQFQQRR